MKTHHPKFPQKSSGARRLQLAALTGAVLIAGLSARAQSNPPYSSQDWPPTIDPNAAVDWGVFDPAISFFFPSTPGGWVNSVSLSGGGDQAYASQTLDGQIGDQGTSSFMNIADGNYAQFANTPEVDVLLEVYGDDSLYNSDGSGKVITFREGILGTELPVSAGAIPTGANNGHWNWMLFSITNPVSPNVENTSGERYIGFQSGTVPPGAENGGVNDGTLRVEGVPGMGIRAIAIGPKGAFGTSNLVNSAFFPPAACPPEPPVNLASVDINAGVTNHLVILNDGDQTVAIQSNVGPAGDLRKAVQATSSFMNFGIQSNYLGQPCNPNRTMKVCVEFYDDPTLIGATIQPENYAADTLGDVSSYTGPAYQLTGTGGWVKLAFWVQSVNLTGINTGSYTGGPRLTFSGGYPFIDKVELGIVRSGTNALAGLDPDPSYLLDPKICTTNYGYYIQLDMQNGISDGLTIGSSGGDQNMVIEYVGPTNDQRLSEAPTAGNNNIQFSIIPNGNGVPPLGPTYQDNLDVLMALDYYDDPAMAGARLYPWPYDSLKFGVDTTSFMNTLTGTNVFGKPFNYRETLTGSGTWKTAYWELPNVNLRGINQGPQSIVRFQTDPATNGVPASGDIHVSRVQFCIVRPCGPLEGINVFQSIGVSNASPFQVTWHGTATVQAKSTLASGPWSNVYSATNLLQNTSVYAPSTSGSSGFFRLTYPHSPLP
ncbi:MAG TPA: hypothetical protein VHB20_18160 [Verrucomicrobiae bacterium]|jgi:hypothetical protein|nr:hypothetical protein [Verrucomicrobiae bacterium]